MTENLLKIEGAKLLATLPKGEWQMCIYGNSIILVCPEHPPMIKEPGKPIRVLEIKPSNAL